MGVLDAAGVSLYIPPRSYPFPVSYISPVETGTTETGTSYAVYELPQNYKTGEIRIVGTPDARVQITVGGQTVPVFVTNIRTRLIRNSRPVGFTVTINNWWEFVLPFEVELDSTVSQGPCVSQNPEAGYIYPGINKWVWYRAQFTTGGQVRVEYSGTVYTTKIEVVAFELNEPAIKFTADSYSLRRVFWALEDQVFDRPRLYSAGEWLLVIDSTRSFVYNVITEEVIDVEPLDGIHASGEDRFYCVDQAGTLYEITPPYTPRVLRTLSFVPDTSANGREYAFVKLATGTYTAETLGYNFTITNDTSYVFEQGDTSVSGQISSTGTAVRTVLYADRIIVIVREPYGYVVCTWDLVNNPPPAEPTKTALDLYTLDDTLVTDKYILSSQQNPVPDDYNQAYPFTVGYAGRYWMATFNGSTVDFYWLVPQSQEMLATDWVDVDKAIYVEAQNAFVEVQEPGGETHKAHERAVIMPQKFLVKLKSFFDVFDTESKIKAVFGSAINTITIVRGPYYKGGIDWSFLNERYPNMTISEIDLSMMTSSASVVYILTPGTFVHVSTGCWRMAALFPWTAAVYYTGAGCVSFFWALVIPATTTTCLNPYNCLVLNAGVTITSNNTAYYRYADGLRLASGQVLHTSPYDESGCRAMSYKLVTLAYADLFVSNKTSPFYGSYAPVEILPATTQGVAGDTPVFSGSQYRLVYYVAGGDLVIVNHSDVDYTGPVIARTGIEALGVQFAGGITAKVVTAPSGARWLYIPQVTVPAHQLLSLTVESYLDTAPDIADPALERYLYEFSGNLYDLSQTQSWGGNGDLIEGTFRLSSDLTKVVASKGSLVLELDTAGCEILVDGVEIGRLIGDTFMPSPLMG